MTKHFNRSPDAPFGDDNRQDNDEKNENNDNNDDSNNKNKMTHTEPATPESRRLLSEVSSTSVPHTPTSASCRPTLSLGVDGYVRSNMSIPLSSYSVCTPKSGNSTLICAPLNIETKTTNSRQRHLDTDPDYACETLAGKDVKFNLDSVKTSDVFHPCNTHVDIPALTEANETTSTCCGDQCVAHGKSDTKCAKGTDENVRHYRNQHCQEPRHKSVTFHEHPIQANSPTSSTDGSAAANGQDEQDKFSDHDGDDSANNPLPNQQHVNPEEPNYSSNHSWTGHFETAHSHSRTLSQYFDKAAGLKSRSERFFDRHLRGRSLHSEGSAANASSSGQSKNGLFARLFERSTRTRTVTTSQRSGLGIGGLLREGDSGTGESTEVTTSVIVDCSKGRSNFVHRVTAEALPHISFTGMKISNKDRSKTRAKPSTAAESLEHSTSASNNEIGMPKLAAKGRADSVKKERRGRSFFRTKERKRSRAKSPGPRRGIEHRKLVGSATGTAGMGMSVSNIRWIRRESPSPKPAARKRSWPRKVMSRVERERRATLKKNDGGGAESSTASCEKDVEVKKKGCPGEKSDNCQSDHDSANRLLTLS